MSEIHFQPIRLDKLPKDYKKCTAINAGFKQSLFTQDSKDLFFCGFNYFGESGFSRAEAELITSYKQVEIPVDSDEHIVQVEIGKAHSIVLSSKNKVYIF